MLCERPYSGGTISKSCQGGNQSPMTVYSSRSCMQPRTRSTQRCFTIPICEAAT